MDYYDGMGNNVTAYVEELMRRIKEYEQRKSILSTNNANTASLVCPNPNLTLESSGKHLKNKKAQ